MFEMSNNSNAVIMNGSKSMQHSGNNNNGINVKPMKLGKNGKPLSGTVSAKVTDYRKVK